MPTLKFAVLAVALFGVLGATINAELSLAQQGAFSVEDAYAQMGGMPFEGVGLPVTLARNS